MNVVTNKQNKKDDGSISFPALQSWNPVTKVATIAAQVSGRRVLCRIRIDDLRKRYKIFSGEPMQSITNHRTEIEDAVKKLIEQKEFEEDGSIMIAYKDL